MNAKSKSPRVSHPTPSVTREQISEHVTRTTYRNGEQVVEVGVRGMHVTSAMRNTRPVTAWVFDAVHSPDHMDSDTALEMADALRKFSEVTR